jgi:hypothetical protein
MSNIDFGNVPDDTPREQPRWAWWLFGAGLVSALAIAASMVSPYVWHQLAISLFRQTTPYTQLAFKDATTLPGIVAQGQPMGISFTITNDEGKSVDYHYVVSSGSGTGLVSLTSGSSTVAAGATWVVNTTVVSQCTRDTCRVQVSLPEQNESIDFIYQGTGVTKGK